MNGHGSLSPSDFSEEMKRKEESAIKESSGCYRPDDSSGSSGLKEGHDQFELLLSEFEKLRLQAERSRAGFAEENYRSE